MKTAARGTTRKPIWAALSCQPTAFRSQVNLLAENLRHLLLLSLDANGAKSLHPTSIADSSSFPARGRANRCARLESVSVRVRVMLR